MHPPDAQRPADWYSVLGLDASATTEHIIAAVERLARQANALSLTAPDRARQLRDQVRAIKQDLLSGPEQRRQYDRQLATPQAPPAGPAAGGHPAAFSQQPQRGGLMARVTQFLQSGWTCATCGYGALPTDKFCPKCGGKIQPGIAPSAVSPEATPASCSACGNAIAPGDLFCTKCGTLRARQ